MSEFYIGRQPIFDCNMDVYAYELLFRSSEQNSASFFDGAKATSTVIINTFTEIGIEKLVGNRPAFINMPYDFLVDPEMISFPPKQVVLEILEDVEIDQKLIDRVRELNAAGYTLALDDFIFSEQWRPLIDEAAIVKFDITQLDRSALKEQVEMMQSLGKLTLAERIETQDEYDELKELNFDYYQGYFFAKPRVISGKRVPVNKLGLVELLARINEPNATISSLSEMVGADVALSMKVLKFINSPITGLPRRVENIHQAVIYLGMDTLKSWLTVMAMSEMDDKPEALLNLALSRAKLCQLLAENIPGVDPQAAFTVGLFSLLDTMLDRSMDEVVSSLPFVDSVRLALQERSGPLGDVLSLAVNGLENTEAPQSTTTQIADIGTMAVNAMQWADSASESQAA
ncbi:MAG: EAL and HDOD domain-containing protein [Pseudomonadales bacterium]